MSSKEGNRPHWIGLKKHELPDFVERASSEWVLFGKKNDYPQTLIDLYNNSTIHNAIVTGKTHFIAGNGVSVDTEKIKTVQGLADARQIINNANPNESFNKVVRKAALDLELFNAIALEIIYKANGKFDLYHVDCSLVRVNSDGSKYAYSPDWNKIKNDTKDNRDKGFKVWNAYDKKNKKGSQLLYFQVHRAG